MRHRARGLIFRLPLLVAVVLSTACGGQVEGEVEDPFRDLREQLGVAPDRTIHEVLIGGRGSEEHLVPPAVEADRSDLVVFTAIDGRVHTLSFPPDSLALDVALFLERTGQEQSPPLIDRGSRFVVSLEGAPEGRYRFLSRGPGGEAWGVLVVGSVDG